MAGNSRKPKVGSARKRSTARLPSGDGGPRKSTLSGRKLRAAGIRRERLRLIAGFTGKIVGDEPLVQQAREMAEEARATFDADACVIRLLEGDDLVLLASVGMPAKSAHPRLPIGWGISKEIISRRRPIFIRDVAKHPQTARVRNRLPNSYQFTSYAGTPLIAKDHVIGIFGLYTVEMMDSFSEDDLNLLRIFGNNMSAAILNERLYEEVTRQRDGMEAHIAERRRAEEALRLSEDRYRRVVEDLSEFVVRWLPDGTCTFANESYCRYFGLSRAQALSSNIFSLIVDQDREELMRRLSAITPQKSVHTAEYRVHLPSGRVGWTEWTGRALFDEHGHLREFQSVGRDIGERKRLHEQLMQARKMESIGTLAGGIAHDFGNVLAVILGNVSLLQRQQGLSPKSHSLLADVATAAERGSAFTQQLLAYAHGVARQLAPVNLNQLVKSVFGMLERVAPRGVTFDLRLTESLPQVLADGVQIEQVVMNLGLNAAQASSTPSAVVVETGEQMIEAEAAARMGIPAERYLLLRVSDTGTGIKEEFRERIFEPFFTTKPMGRGMGLATTRAIVDDHKGCIQIDSAPGEGTTVTVWLPLNTA